MPTQNGYNKYRNKIRLGNCKIIENNCYILDTFKYQLSSSLFTGISPNTLKL